MKNPSYLLLSRHSIYSSVGPKRRIKKAAVADDSVFKHPIKVLSAYVDAENGFGAMIRTRYICTVEYAGGKGGGIGN